MSGKTDLSVSGRSAHGGALTGVGDKVEGHDVVERRAVVAEARTIEDIRRLGDTNEVK